MGFPLTPEQVMALAPDASSASAGKKLSMPRPWQQLGRNDVALWGACQGSGKDPYQVRVALENYGVSCTCPSRKFPCKHGLGLMLMAASAPDAVPVAEPPEWVAAWLAKRAATAEKQQQPEKATPKSDPAAPPSAAQQKRAAKKLARTNEGLEALDLWMNDLIRAGLASVETQPATFWDHQAKRLVDAQAPGLANYVRGMSEIVGATPDWPGRLLERLGRAALLTQAAQHLDEFDAPMQDELRQIIGWSLNQDEVQARGELVEDEWLIVGQWVEQDAERPQVRYQRTWLRGRASQRAAMILQTSVMGTPFPEIIVPATRFMGALRFWPGAVPVRARIEMRQGQAANLIAERLPGVASIDAFLRQMAALLARQPWQAVRRLGIFCAVVPVCAENGAHWWVQDAAGDALVLVGDHHWKLLALSGGKPVDLAAEWDGERLRPLGTFAEGTYTLLGGVQ